MNDCQQPTYQNRDTHSPKTSGPAALWDTRCMPLCVRSTRPAGAPGCVRRIEAGCPQSCDPRCPPGLVGHLAETRGAATCPKASTALVSPLRREALLADFASNRVAEQVVLAERAHGDSSGPAVRALSKGSLVRWLCPLSTRPFIHVWKRTRGVGVSRGRPQREPRAAAAGRGEHGGAAREHAASLMGCGSHSPHTCGRRL